MGNSITNIESDTKANLKSDHYPLTATVIIKLKAISKHKGPGRKKYTDSTTEQQKQNNKRMYDDIKESINKEDNIETNTNKYIQILKKTTTHLTHLTPKEKRLSIFRQNK